MRPKGQFDCGGIVNSAALVCVCYMGETMCVCVFTLTCKCANYRCVGARRNQIFGPPTGTQLTQGTRTHTHTET